MRAEHRFSTVTIISDLGKAVLGSGHGQSVVTFECGNRELKEDIGNSQIFPEFCCKGEQKNGEQRKGGSRVQRGHFYKVMKIKLCVYMLEAAQWGDEENGW